MADDLRAKIAEVLAGHRGWSRPVAAKYLRCVCGNWEAALDPDPLRAHDEHERHVAEAILAAIGEAAKDHYGDPEEES